jgi:hypothetical protein
MAAAQSSGMRIPALSSTLVVGTLVTLLAPAHAERKASHGAANQVAALSGPAREDRAARAQITGERALTGSTTPAASARAQLKEPFLEAGDITTRVAPHNPEIERCYLDEIGTSRRPGRLDLTFEIARDGAVLSVKAAATGLSTKLAHKVEACIHASVDGIEFPVRRNDTTAVVPYFFQKTDAPNAGPQLSCWNPKGC